MMLNEPLSISDIRKEQRRLTALLGSLNEIPKFKIRRGVLPNNYCYICSRLAPGGKFRTPNGMFFGKGLFGKCEHLPQTPYPTVVGNDEYGMDRPYSESSVNIVKNILKKTKQGSKLAFTSKTPVGKEHNRATFSISSEATSRTEFNEEEENEFHLPPIGPGQISIVVKASRQMNGMAKIDINKQRSIRFAEESIGEEPSLAATDDSGHLSYHHRSSVENVPVAGFDALCKPKSHENSVVSREGTLMASENSFIIERIASGEWCDCIDVDLSNLLCSECDCVGFHNKTCSLLRSNSKLDLCPNCGKPIKQPRRSHRTSRETSMSRRETERRTTCSRELRPKVRSNYRKNMFNQDHVYNSADENYMDVEEIIYDDDGYLSPEDEFDEEFEMRKRNAKPWPTYDPMIHKEAYDRALGEARNRRVRKLHIEALDEGMMKSTVTKPFNFSYYRLLPFIKKRDTGLQSLANPEDNEHLKIKNGMKHIFGDVKVDDYYPKAKNGKNAANKITLKPESTDIRTQLQVTNHTPF